MGHRRECGCLCVVFLSVYGGLYPSYTARYDREHELGEVSVKFMCFGIVRPGGRYFSCSWTANLWTSVVTVGITAYVLMAWYLWQRHVYKGPKVNVRLQERIHHDILYREHQSHSSTIVGIEMREPSPVHGQKPVKGE